MKLTPEQRTAVGQWIAAGETLAQVQRRLVDEFKVSMTYMEVRFLVDDLGLELKNPEPKKSVAPAADLGAKNQPMSAEEDARARAALFGDTSPAPRSGIPEAAGAGDTELVDDDEFLDEEPLPADGGEETAPLDDLAAAPGAAGAVKVEVDRITRPGTLVSGAVTFSDGVSGKWAMDQFGRLMLDAGKGYKPPQADIQAFQTELSRQLQKMGF